MQKILFYNKFIIRLYMFRALCAHHQEVKIVYSIWYRHTETSGLKLLKYNSINTRTRDITCL